MAVGLTVFGVIEAKYNSHSYIVQWFWQYLDDIKCLFECFSCWENEECCLFGVRKAVIIAIVTSGLYRLFNFL